MTTIDFNDLLNTLVTSEDFGISNAKYSISEESLENFLVSELGYQIVDSNSKLITKSEVDHALRIVNEFIKNKNKK